MTLKPKNIETILAEKRIFKPSKKFQQGARISSMKEYLSMYEKSIKRPEEFWGDAACELAWFKKWSKVLDETDAPFYKWFADGKTNITFNCLDRHLDTATRNKAA
ncbi:acetyl-CoA synthetase, partial [bacterium]